MRKSLMLALPIGLALLGSTFLATGWDARAQDKATPAPITQGAANIKRTPVQKFDVAGTNLETVIAIAEIIPNVNIGRHSHPGIESAYVMEGELVLTIDGQPEKAVKPGDSWHVPAGAVHDAKSGAKGAKVIVTYVVEKGKPLASPAK